MQKRKQKEIALPAKFIPQFWDCEDRRLAVVRAIQERYELLKADCGADSYQKEILCQRAVFIALQLETMEIKATKGGDFSPGVYAQMSNSLLGLLKTLGLERKVKKVTSLENYIDGSKKNGNRKRKRREV